MTITDLHLPSPDSFELAKNLTFEQAMAHLDLVTSDLENHPSGLIGPIGPVGGPGYLMIGSFENHGDLCIDGSTGRLCLKKGADWVLLEPTRGCPWGLYSPDGTIGGIGDPGRVA